jgi:ubiquinone/menaquinone biosynthesis C-methylase UbiE
MKNMTALDLGCGNNRISTTYIGVDSCPNADATILTDLEDLSQFNDGSVNVVFTRRALQHVTNDVQALKEINRVLTSDGMAVVEVASFWNATLSAILNRLKLKKHPYRSFHIYTTNSLKEAIRKSGLRLVTIASAPTMTPLFRNHLAVLVKGS